MFVLLSLVTAPLVFVAMARHEVGPSRPVGTVCAFEHDPGSGRSADGHVEHRGWLVPREACVHATDGENEQAIGAAPFVGALVAPGATALVLFFGASRLVPPRNGRTVPGPTWSSPGRRPPNRPPVEVRGDSGAGQGTRPGTSGIGREG